VLRDATVRRLALAAFVMDALELGFLGFTAVYLQQERGFSDAASSAMLSVVLLGGLAGFAAIAVSGYRPGIGALRAAAAVQAMGIIGVLALPGPLGIALGELVLGAAGAVWWVTFQAAVLRVRPSQTGTTWAVVNYLSLPALAAGPVIGFVADRFGVSTAMALFPALAALGVLAAPGRMPLPRLRRWATRS
jgi:hypothetical protein